MILRIFALYGKNLQILGFLLFLLTLQVVLGFVGMGTGFRTLLSILVVENIVVYLLPKFQAVPLPPGLHGMIFLSQYNPSYDAGAQSGTGCILTATNPLFGATKIRISFIH